MRLQFDRWLLTSLLCALVIGSARADEWTLMELTLDVRLDPAQETMESSGTLTLRCDEERSDGPVLALNGRDAAVQFVEIDGRGVARSEINALDPESEALRLARIELQEPATTGQEIELRFRCKLEGKAFQTRVDADLATASWTDGWYPAPHDDGDRSLSQRMSAPGHTTIRMPVDWTSLSEGELVQRTEDDAMAVEEWRVDMGIARSFAAGPYQVAREEFGQRSVGVYLLSADETAARNQAKALSAAIEAMEARFGAFPYPSYGIAEVPMGRYSWSAASQQGLILADESCFVGEDGNLPLFAHEAAHAWWGNLVGTTGPGSILCSESLAQYGAVVAMEGVRGVDAATHFLRFSAPGYSSQQCAKGYFEMIAMSEDLPLSKLEGGGWQHHLSDAKGHWVYHMLRRRVGDELFFTTLRELIGRYAGRRMALDDLRAAFQDIAPLETFFEQWLDRTGAPDLELEWSVRTDDTIEGVIRQAQPGEPYELRVDVVALASDGEVVGKSVVEVTGEETVFSLAVEAAPDVVEVDPEHRILRWEPDYGPRPSVASVDRDPDSRSRSDESLLADLDDGIIASVRGSGWKSTSDGVFGGSSTASLALANGGAEESAHCLRIYGELKSGFDRPFGGAMYFTGEAPMAEADLSAWSGIRFWAKGPERDYVLGMFRAANAMQPITTVFHATEEWSEIRVDFTEFGESDGSDVTAFFIGAGGALGPFDLTVDQLRLVSESRP